MAITNPKTKEKMKKKNPKSIRVGDDGSVSKKSTTKPKKGMWDWLKGDRFKKKEAEKISVAKGKANKAASETMKAAEKKYAKESMFSKARDTAKTTPGKARPFKIAFDDATSKGKDRFSWKGKSYLTTKGKRADRFPVTTDKKKAAPAGKEQRQILKRVKWMEKRKEAGKGYSAKNLAELTKKLEELNIR